MYLYTLDNRKLSKRKELRKKTPARFAAVYQSPESVRKTRITGYGITDAVKAIK